MSAIDEFLKNNEAFVQRFDKGELPLPPAKRVAIVACMDARLNPYPILGLSIGDAHVIRNAGGVITDDEIAAHAQRVIALLQELDATLTPAAKQLTTDVLCELAVLYALQRQHATQTLS